MINTKKILCVMALSAMSLTTFAETPVTTSASLTWNTISWTTTNNEVQTDFYIVNSVKTIDEKTLTVDFDKQLPSISWDSVSKVLEDIGGVSVLADDKDEKKLSLSLETQLVSWEKYSLISIAEDFDASADFTYTAWQNEVKLQNNSKIEKLVFASPNSVDVYLTSKNESVKNEFKLYKEITSQSMFSDWVNLNISLATALASNKSYILTLELKDDAWKDLEVENSLFDFTTTEFNSATKEEDPTQLTNLENVLTNMTNSWSLENTTNSTSSWELTSTWNIEEIALNAQKTPETWAKTNLLILVTLLTSALILVRKKSLKI